MEFTIGLESPFNLDATLESGQVFRWERKGEWWLGIVSGGVLKVRQEGDSLRCSSASDMLGSGFVRNYFRLGDNLDDVLGSIAKDETITQAIQKFYGLRLIRQERWECLASFLLSTNTNIPRIRMMVSAICAKYGEPFDFEGVQFRAFPKPDALADASVADLRVCGLGYRAPFLKHVAASVAAGRVDFTELEKLDYEMARKELLVELLGEKLLLGVGPKVADCVLLYSLGKDEAFPIDVWIARELVRSYPRLFDPSIGKKLEGTKKLRLGLGSYDRISRAVRDYFGRYAGYAQQYLYMAARSADA